MDSKTYLSECAETSKNTTTDPGGVLALGGCRDTDLHVLDGKAFDFAHQTVGEVLAECGSTRKHDVQVE